MKYTSHLHLVARSLAIQSLATRSLTILLLLLVFTARASVRPLSYGPGFDAAECEDIFRLNFAFLDTSRTQTFPGFVEDYRIHYRSPAVGLDNASDIWLRTDSTVVILLRGTTANAQSIMADFYCAMVPARGTVTLDNYRSFTYNLARDPRAAVHAGFLLGFAFVATDLRPYLDRLFEQGYRNFIVGGHSQGGALCYYMSAWLLQLRTEGAYPGIQVKTYASAPPKMGNMYFSYDYDNATQSQWTFSIVNSADPVPEMPFTTQQVDIDMNEPNPILNLMKQFDKLPFFQRIMLKRSFNSMRKKARKSSEAYQKYLGNYVGDFIHRSLPETALPPAVATTYFVRPGVHIILASNDAYTDFYQGAPRYFHHGLDPYRYLLRQYYEGLSVFTPLAPETGSGEQAKGK